MLPEALFGRKKAVPGNFRGSETEPQPGLRANLKKSPYLKLHLSNAPGRNTVTAYGTGFVEVNGERHLSSLVILPTHLEPHWTLGPDNEISADAIRFLASCEAEIVLIGTGSEQRFPHPAALRPLIEAGIGFEVMSTPAACRTYNILVAEDRLVAAGLVV
ncbi:MAG: Mth938-like domain-containing protein [Betaproteobacteria bacterium]|nr:MAG: Mth938-like domain-containing protein [Betaproteobacteria bacterium]